MPLQEERSPCFIPTCPRTVAYRDKGQPWGKAVAPQNHGSFGVEMNLKPILLQLPARQGHLPLDQHPPGPVPD